MRTKLQGKKKVVKEYQQEDEARKSIKKIGIFSTFAMVLLLVVGFVLQISPAYAAITNTSLPEEFTSKLGDNESVALFGKWDPSEGDHMVSVPATFTGEYTGSSGTVTLEDIYCLERHLGISGDATYVKGNTVAEANYPGIVYILDNNGVFRDLYSSSIKNLHGTAVSEAAFIHYMTQVTIWWYIDIQNGYAPKDIDNGGNGTNTLVGNTPAGTDESGYYDDGEYNFLNNLSVNDKALIRASEYWPTIRNMLNEALNYIVESGSNDISINGDNITYQASENSLLTSAISVNSSKSSFSSYKVTVSDSRIKVLNSNMVETTEFTSQESFRLSIPTDLIEDNKLSVQVTVTGTFKQKNAYVYNPKDNLNLQRTVLGIVTEDTASAELPLEYEVEVGQARIRKIDAETGENLAGATLVINDSLGNQVATFETTGEDMLLTLPIGEYTVTETKAPEGYTVENNSKSFTVGKDTLVEVVLENVKPIDVPNTASDQAYIYGIGISIVIVGIILIVVATRSKNAKRSKK